MRTPLLYMVPHTWYEDLAKQMPKKKGAVCMIDQNQWKGNGPSARKLEVGFDGGAVTSDGGVLGLGLADRQLNLLSRVAAAIPDERDPTRIEHSVHAMLCQRVFGLCLGYEDLNDHASLRHDIGFQTAAKRDEVLASPSTLCRLENWATRESNIEIHRILLDVFIQSFEKPPEEIILDFDATDDRVHGDQLGKHFNSYYDAYIFLPLHVYCGDRMLVNYLRPGSSDAAMHAGAVLKILVREIRKHWPETKIVFRADGGFCRKHILGWCERNSVAYIVGLPQNSRLNRLAASFAERAERAYKESKVKSRVIDSFYYSAGSWNHTWRKVICRAEYGEKKLDCRYVVTNIKGCSKYLYETLYCGRGEAENHIKDVKLSLFCDRTSCVHWDANQFRALLSTLAYTIMEHVRRVGFGIPDPEFAENLADETRHIQRISFENIRLRMLKVGGVIIRNTRRIVFRLSSGFPLQKEFLEMLERLSPA